MTAGPSTESVWLQLSGDLRRFIRRRVADDHLADDLLQETFVRIHRNIERLNESDRLAAWVYQIARNVVHDHYRKAAPNTVALADSDSVSGDEAASGQLRGQAGQWLDELIRELPDKYRQAVQLCEIEGRTQQQVAERLGLSLSGAKSRIQRGRAMLKSVLDQCCTFEFDRRGNLLGAEPKPDRTVCLDCDQGDDPARPCP
ncbi:MAG: RNA polymerase sigma factor SigZ [Pirellulales bacterium]